MAKVEDNRIPEIEEETVKALGRAFTMIGLKWAGFASAKCRTDTGLLKNSITYAVDGQKVAKTAYKADKGDKAGKYSGRSINAGKHENMGVTVGTNVEYAPYIEFGTSKMKQKGGYPFIRPSLENNIDYYKRILEDELGDVE